MLWSQKGCWPDFTQRASGTQVTWVTAILVCPFQHSSHNPGAVPNQLLSQFKSKSHCMSSKLASTYRWEGCPLLMQNWEEFQKLEAECAGIGMPGPLNLQKFLMWEDRTSQGQSRSWENSMRPDCQAELIRATGHCRPLPMSLKVQKAWVTPEATKRWPQVLWGPKGTCQPQQSTLEPRPH